MTYALALKCLDCGRDYDHAVSRYTCDACGAFLDVVMDLEALARDLDPRVVRRRSPVIWKRWREWLPVLDECMERVSLDEYETPLISSPPLAAALGVRELFIKSDTYFPSGSLKDRSMPMVVSKALEFGAKTVCIMSAGNAASSLATYAARAGLRAVVVMRKGAPSDAQLAHMLMLGATAVLVEDPRDEVFFALRDKHGWYDCDGQVNPFRLEGKKTYAYAIWDQLGGTLPDRVAMTVGSGTGIVALWKGLTELRALGWLESARTPVLTAVQPEASSPIVDAFNRGDTRVTPVKRKPSICNISPGDPGPGGDRALRVLKDAGADATAASDAELVEAMRLLASQGFYTEPAGAVAMGGLLRLKREGKLSADERVVAVITGHGLKQPELIRTLCGDPIESGSTQAEIERALGLA